MTHATETRIALLSRRHVLLGAASTAVAALLAACGSSSKATDTPAAKATVSAVTGAAGTPTSAPAGGTPSAAKKRGGTLTIGMPSDFASFDPFFLGFSNFPFIQNIYDTLIRYTDKLEPLPGLAEKWTVAPDGASVTLNLRKGAKYHSGKELVADDVIKNFAKAQDKDKGFNIFPLVANVDSVTAPDPSTVLIKFKGPTAGITDILQSMAIIEPAAIDALKTRGSGTGPYKFTEWVPGDHTTLERNPDYWGKPGPYLDRITYKVFNDSDAMVAALQSGIADMIISLPPKDASRLAADFNIVRGYPGALTYEVRINPTKAPFDKKEARQAIQYAIDRKGIVDRVLFGISQPTVLPYSTNSPAYDTSIMANYPFDVNKAKDLFAKAGVTNGKAETIVISQFPELVAMAQVLKADLAKIGFDLTVTPVDQTESNRRVLSGDYQVTVSFSGNTQKYPTRIALNSIYRPAANPVWGDAIPKTYVDVINEANATVDPAKQKAVFQKLNAILLDESWVVSIAYRQSVFGLAKYVKDFAFTVDDMVVLENVSKEK